MEDVKPKTFDELQQEYYDLLAFCEQVITQRDKLDEENVNLKHQVIGYQAVISYLEHK